jgi:RNA polymerase sigma factor (sigma-70 family)
MEDSEVVAAIVAGDSAGLGEAYDRYAVPLYAYCRSMLREPADAADAVQDTFVTAVAKLSGLREPAKLRAWLYAVARNECLRRLRAADATSALDEAADLPVETGDVGSAAEQDDLRALVRDAIDGLNPAERDVIELSLAPEIDADDLAAALGVSRNHAHALLSRARSQLERSLGALVVARTGRQACPALAAMLAGWDGRMNVLMRKRISRHIEQCGACGERKRRELSPALFAAGLPVPALLPAFRDQVLRMCTGNTPAALAHRAGVLARAGKFGPAGFPKPASPPGASAWHWAAQHSHAVAAGAATSATAVVIAAATIGGGGPHHGAPSAAGPAGPVVPNAAAGAVGGSSPGARAPGGGTALAPSGSASATAGPGSPGATGTPAGSPGTTGSPGATAPGTPGPTDTPGAASSSPAPSPSASPSSTGGGGGGEGTLTISSSAVTLTGGNGTPTGTFTITASGGPIQHYNITVRSAHYLTVTPSAGSLAAGQSVTVTVTASRTSSFSTWILVDPGGNKVSISYGG